MLRQIATVPFQVSEGRVVENTVNVFRGEAEILLELAEVPQESSPVSLGPAAHLHISREVPTEISPQNPLE